jgi:orotidine-5'-phosphate decarboxylase
MLVGPMMLDGVHDAVFEPEGKLALTGKSRSSDVPLDRRLVVALDVPNVDEAKTLVHRLGDAAKFYKIGLELAFGGGLKLAEELRDQGKWIFLDMKLLDIGNTVEKAVANVARLGFKFLTVHGQDTKTLQAAIDGRGASDLGLLAVTVLTNYTSDDLREQGTLEDTAALTLRRARLAYKLGFDGVIASGYEAEAIRRATSSRFVIKTPGIRPAGSSANDQARVMTPRQAIVNGANYLVVGRPIIHASDPKRIAQQITHDIKAGLDELEHTSKA